MLRHSKINDTRLTGEWSTAPMLNKKGFKLNRKKTQVLSGNRKKINKLRLRRKTLSTGRQYKSKIRKSTYNVIDPCKESSPDKTKQQRSLRQKIAYAARFDPKFADRQLTKLDSDL